MALRKMFFVLPLVFLFLFDSSISTLITIDHNGDIETAGLYFDHIEGSNFYRTAEDLLGIGSSAMNATAKNVGIWLFQSAGENGCCGGMWELSSNYPLYNYTDTAEIFIRYYSNVELRIRPTIDTLAETRVTLPPTSDSIINWTSQIIKINTTATNRLNFVAQFGSDRKGFLLLDKIVIAVNERIVPWSTE